MLRLRSAFFLLGCALFGFVMSARAQDEVDLEWAIRRSALAGQELAGSGLDRELDWNDDSWVVRLAAIEAMRRKLELGTKFEEDAASRLVLRITDDSPNVRARALNCLGLLGFSRWGRPSLEALAQDPSPEVRAELCRAVPGVVWLEHSDLLLELAWSSELSVRSSARRVVDSWGALGRSCAEWSETQLRAISELQAKLFSEVREREGGLSYLREVEAWLRPARVSASHPDPELVASVFPAGESRRAARALWTALHCEVLAPEGAKALAAGWTDSLDPEHLDQHRLQREWLLAAAPCYGEALAEPLAVRLAHLEFPKKPLEYDTAREEFLAGMIAATGPDQVADSLLERRASAAVLRDFWELVDPVQISFDVEARSAWLAVSFDRELRVDVAEVLARSFLRSPTEDAREGLVELLRDEDSEVRELAFRTLCSVSAEDLLIVEPRLFEAWKDLTIEARLSALTRLPRERSLPSFRSALLELGADFYLRSEFMAILELLGLFRGDKEVSLAVGAWLLADASRVANGAQPETRPAARAVRAARAGANALHTIGGENAVSTLAQALEVTTGIETEVAIDLISRLGKSGGGREALRRFFRAELPSREKIEVALALGSDSGHSERVDYAEYLRSRFDVCDGALRTRIWRLLVGLHDEESCAFAEKRFFDAALPIEQRAPALEVLLARYQSTRTSAGLEALFKCVEGATDVESERMAIEAVGHSRASQAADFLRPRLEASRAADDVERENLLVALARCAPHSEFLWSELWSEPIRAGEEQLQGRFRGEQLAAVNFSFRGELESLQVLCEAGAWRENALPELFRLDGRLALALAEACRRGGQKEPARLLERHALVALEGELPVQKTQYALLQARLRLWADSLSGGDAEEVAWHASRVLSGWYSGSVTERDLEGVLGIRDPEQGRDPLARIQASAFQGLALQRAREGGRECARRLLDRAEVVLGASSAAQQAQAEAEARLR